jgi:hypothetical protein
MVWMVSAELLEACNPPVLAYSCHAVRWCVWVYVLSEDTFLSGPSLKPSRPPKSDVAEFFCGDTIIMIII